MGQNRGRVREIRLGASGQVEVSIFCPAAAIPAPGQYLLATDPADLAAVIGTPLFAVETTNQGFWSAPLHPVSWGPGTDLELVGPLGHGFSLPGNLQRLGLVALGDTASRLLPLVDQTVQTSAGMTLFTDLSLSMLPFALEVYPLASLKETLDWPDYLAIDVPMERLEAVRNVLGLAHGAVLPCPTQVLVTTPMPCAGLGQCGACAVPGHRGWKLACEDGPVFDLKGISW